METEMEMPTPCQKCGEIFDLNDGISSEKWYIDTVICESCGRIEADEMEKDEEIQDLKAGIEDAVFTIKENHARLKELEKNTSSIFLSLS